MANKASGPSSSSAPSCSNSTPYPYYDVFINHRGPDVKNTFAAHLYRRLRDHGLQVFLDKPELQEGHPITPQICAAIEVASLHIAIFSPTYAESKWCLDELVLMLKSKATILPVFYKVEPNQLRWTVKDGAYAKALRGLEQKKSVDAQTGEEKPRYDSNTIRSWRDALSKAADISGFELQGDKEELLTRVVQRALKIVPKPPLYVAKYPTGVDDKLQDFEATVMQQQEHRASARVVGIVGFGGIGKTTLAKTFFNSKRSYYSESSFLFDVRETSAKFSLGYLQSKLIEDLKHINIKIEHPDEGVGMLGRYLSSCQALVILDDVDSVKQLDMLLPIKDILSPESLILITSRDKHVLESSCSSIYNLKGLNTQHSTELFCSYAFYRPLPPQEFEGLVDRFVRACDGLPLSLKVVGALVCGKDDKVYWKEQLDRLHQTLPSEIQDRLRISYDSLSEKDQEIFLDIACFFLGEDRDKAIRIWGLVGLRNLEDKCLLEVDSESKIRMHDHIRDCARNIAEKGSMPRRLWHRTNIMDDLLELTQSGVTGVRGITTATYFDLFQRKDWDQPPIYMGLAVSPNPITNGVDPSNNSHFRGSRNLQLVAAERSDLEIILTWAQSRHLLWLRWNRCYDSSLPAWIPMENLRVLEVSGSRLSSLWPHQSQGPLQLRELNICAPLSEFPKSIGQLQHLERIIISYCDKNLTVEFLPEDFGRLCSLKYLVLKNFSKMMSLPDSFGKLTNLRHIDLGGASSLQMLPNSFEDLSRLEHLSLYGATNIKLLPDSFGKLTNLQHIDLGYAIRLQMLPNSFGDLSRLEHLSLSNAKTIKLLPDSFGKLTNLRHIDLGGASSMQMLPNSFGDLSRLEYLSLHGARDIKLLPDSFGKLTNLRHINLGAASSLQMLPNSFGDLSRLEHLSLQGAGAIKLLPDSFGKLTNLQHIDLGGAYSLQMLPNSFGDLSRLEHLSLYGATAIKLLPDCFGKLTNLRHIDLGGASSLQVLPNSFGDLSQLEHLSLEGCSSLTISSGALGNITTLKYLNLQRCSNLKELAPQIARQRSLKNLFMASTELKELQCFIEDLCNLEVLHIGSPPSVRCSERLEELQVPHSPKLKCLPVSFGHFTQMKELVLEGCGIEYLPQGLLNLNNLRKLEVVDCPLREFPIKPDEGEAEGGKAWNQLESLVLKGAKLSEVAFPKGVCPNLRYLEMDNCQELRGIPGLCDLSKLGDLSIQDCVKVEDLESLENLRSLWRVRVTGCRRLRSIQGLAQLTQLYWLEVRGCHEMVGLPGVEQCMRLGYLDARDCPKLQWGGGVLQQLRHRPKGRSLHIDVIPYKRRKLRGDS